MMAYVQIFTRRERHRDQYEAGVERDTSLGRYCNLGSLEHEVGNC